MITIEPIPPLYLFDLDGTLALTEHRNYLLQSESPDKWRAFYAACDRDAPNWPVIRTMERLRQSGADVWILTGRSSEVRDKTVDWLLRYTSFTRQELEGPILAMRARGDRTADDTLKLKFLEGMLFEDRERLAAVFEDRYRVVAMWRAAGVPCFQVAPGEF